MNLEQLQRQSEKIESFREGYMACLNWIAANMNAEKQAEEASKANDTLPKA